MSKVWFWVVATAVYAWLAFVQDSTMDSAVYGILTGIFATHGAHIWINERKRNSE